MIFSCIEAILFIFFRRPRTQATLNHHIRSFVYEVYHSKKQVASVAWWVAFLMKNEKLRKSICKQKSIEKSIIYPYFSFKKYKLTRRAPSAAQRVIRMQSKLARARLRTFSENETCFFNIFNIFWHSRYAFRIFPLNFRPSRIVWHQWRIRLWVLSGRKLEGKCRVMSRIFDEIWEI